VAFGIADRCPGLCTGEVGAKQRSWPNPIKRHTHIWDLKKEDSLIGGRIVLHSSAL
jgi:hypothetical protein